MNKLLWTYFESDSLIFFSLAIVGMISNILYCTRGKYKGQIAYRYVFVLLVWLLILDVCDRAGVVIPEGVYQAGNFFSCVFLGIMVVISLVLLVCLMQLVHLYVDIFYIDFAFLY